VAGIVGMAAALEVATAQRPAETDRIAALRDRLVDGLLAAVAGVTENGAPRHGHGPRAQRLANVANLGFAGVDNEELLLLLDEDGVEVSAGAACASGAATPSHVLVAMGRSRAEAGCSLRFSMGHTTTASDVERALVVVPKAVGRLRAG
jgi:cysteine desulfurase